MDTAGVRDALKQMSGHLSDLDQTLQPLLTTALSDTIKKLPLLDRAKLYVAICSIIETLLYSYLLLHGVKAREHAVFKELLRVKQYFEKIKAAEAGSTPERKDLTLNKQAAGRMVKHALAGNKKFDVELAARKEAELANARKMLQDMEDRKKLQEERKLKRMSGGDGNGTPTAPQLNGSSEIDHPMPDAAIATTNLEEGEIEGDDDAVDVTDPQTPQSIATSELTDSSKTLKPKIKHKKRARTREKPQELSAKKKRKYDNTKELTITS
ncbi:Nuclear nucleic acid-binding protein C1D [Cyphellophora attinorum]|uniref:Exosome complex protein n=1 Tax=Cyphellophora attinorum TaxID=1664694 RepID=A0A0N0NQB3_9EURO|nr:Nuclear nucleic acid-binding protein C1D [Phialophora attinorum]KPI43708.1 Nuclear nucleic acid-binding protein C1D [Phialophora attinorum]